MIFRELYSRYGAFHFMTVPASGLQCSLRAVLCSVYGVTVPKVLAQILLYGTIQTVALAAGNVSKPAPKRHLPLFLKKNIQ